MHVYGGEKFPNSDNCKLALGDVDKDCGDGRGVDACLGEGLVFRMTGLTENLPLITEMAGEMGREKGR